MTDTFCPIPWIFQAVRTTGDIRVCCQANVTTNKGILRKEDGAAYNASIDSLDESRNASLIKDMRMNMLNGIWNEECGRCQKEEESGLPSRRIREREHYPEYHFEKMLKMTDEDGTIDVDQLPVIYYDLRFGNLCNLKCRMCGPADSSGWYEDWEEFKGEMSFDDGGTIVQIQKDGDKFFAEEYMWPEQDHFWNQMEGRIKHIKHIYFAGGEPLLIQKHYEFLRKCIDINQAKDIIIEYNTNVSTLPNFTQELWKEFKQVCIGASIDGMGKVLEYQRHPIKWEKALSNLRKIDSLGNPVRTWIALTVTAYNVDHLVDFLWWFIFESNFKNIKKVSVHVAHRPMALNIRVLPNEYKTMLLNRFVDLLVRLARSDASEYHFRMVREIIAGISYYMNDSYYDERWEEFKEFTNKLDSIRGEKLIDVVPELGKYL